MTAPRAFLTSLAVMAMTAGLQAQATTETTKLAGAPAVSTTKMTGEVVSVEGSALVVKMQPKGEHRLFNVPPGRQFIIDGQPKLVGDLKPGTVLTATVTTTTQPVTTRTTTVKNGRVWFVSGNHLIVTMPDGENKAYTVPNGYQFSVDGKPAVIQDLKKGMNISGTKIVEEPKNEISTNTVVTGKAPK